MFTISKTIEETKFRLTVDQIRSSILLIINFQNLHTSLFKCFFSEVDVETELSFLGVSKWILDIRYPISKSEISDNWISDTRYFGFRDRVRVQNFWIIGYQVTRYPIGYTQITRITRFSNFIFKFNKLFIYSIILKIK